MKLTPLPKILEEQYDDDSLVYVNDNEFYYSSEVPKELIEDILSKKFMIYSGYYTFHRGDDSPRLYYLGRGRRIGKFKLKIQGFKPFCYDYADDGEYTTYLGEKCEKIIFTGQHPSKVKRYREYKLKRGYRQPLEADILFHRRMLINVYDYFKPKEPIHPHIAVIDIETDYPVSDNIISFAINNLATGELYYESKFDTLSHKELVESLIDKLNDVDIIIGWNIETFDTKIIEKHINFKLHEIISIVDLHVDKKKSICKNIYGKEIRGGWGLDNVGKHLCGIAKSLDEEDTKVPVRELPEEKLFIYNVIDSIIPEIIDNYLGGLETYLILAWSLQSCIDDMIITAVVNDIALLREYHKAGIVLHSRNYEDKTDDEPNYEAAEPDAIPGVYHGVIETDVISAYASAVVAINASIETKDVNGKYIAPNGIRFNDGHSVFIDTLKNLMDDKIQVKKRLTSVDKSSNEYKTLDFIHFAIKTQVAAFSHGLFGWTNSRMREYEVADAITSVLSNLMNKIKTACDLIGMKWIYLHTDSCFIYASKEKKDKILEYLNHIIAKHCAGYKIVPELEFKGWHPHVYIHSKARRVIVPDGIEIDDDENWEVKGCNFMRSETAKPLGDIEVELIKMKLKDKSNEECLKRLREMVIALVDLDSRELALSKPLNKPVKNYGRELLDGSWGGIPAHVKAMIKANKDDGLELIVGKKYGVLPIITSETEGVRKIKMKKVDIAFDLEEGILSKYQINFNYYLDSNLWGKVNDLLGLKVKELKEIILDGEVCEKLGIEYETKD